VPYRRLASTEEPMKLSQPQLSLAWASSAWAWQHQPSLPPHREAVRATRAGLDNQARPVSRIPPLMSLATPALRQGRRSTSPRQQTLVAPEAHITPGTGLLPWATRTSQTAEGWRHSTTLPATTSLRSRSQVSSARHRPGRFLLRGGVVAISRSVFPFALRPRPCRAGQPGGTPSSVT